MRFITVVRELGCAKFRAHRERALSSPTHDFAFLHVRARRRITLERVKGLKVWRCSFKERMGGDHQIWVYVLLLGSQGTAGRRRRRARSQEPGELAQAGRQAGRPLDRGMLVRAAGQRMAGCCPGTTRGPGAATSIHGHTRTHTLARASQGAR